MFKTLSSFFKYTVTNTHVITNNTVYDAEISIKNNASEPVSYLCTIPSKSRHSLPINCEIGIVYCIATVKYSNGGEIEYTFYNNIYNCTINCELYDDHVIYNGGNRGKLIQLPKQANSDPSDSLVLKQSSNELIQLGQTMNHKKVYIYVLKLESNKYYVGKTINPTTRIDDHIDSKGSEWTKKYKPVNIEEIIPDQDDLDEDKITLKYMRNVGINNVRGGSFCQLTLDEATKNVLQTMIYGSSNKCFKCGSDKHYITNCPKKNNAYGTTNTNNNKSNKKTSTNKIKITESTTDTDSIESSEYSESTEYINNALIKINKNGQKKNKLKKRNKLNKNKQNKQNKQYK